jgi:NADH:ubiquinone oxidoreductase subunit F (NADH-binding)
VTAVLPPVADETSTAPTWTIGAPRLLAGLDRFATLDLAAHRHVHGDQPAVDLPRLLTMLDQVALAGRGGAGFPLATKVRALAGGRREVVVNGAESEPGSVKDRTLLSRSPHLVIDGAVGLAAAIGARRITVAVHDAQSDQAVRRAAAERPDGRMVRVHRVEGGFVAGEGRALLRSIRGGPARPPGRRVHATAAGVLLANVETFAQVAVLLRTGAQRYRETGTRGEPGSTLLSVGGAVARPGVAEIPLGTPLGFVLEASGAAAAQAVVVGGYHGCWLGGGADVQLSRAGLTRAGGTFGVGIVLVLDQRTCALGELARVADWLACESAGQCGPCRFGLPALAHDVRALQAGFPAGLPAALAHGRAVDGRGACGHPNGAVRFVRSGLSVLRTEVDGHLRGGCHRPVVGQLPIGGRR